MIVCLKVWRSNWQFFQIKIVKIIWISENRQIFEIESWMSNMECSIWRASKWFPKYNHSLFIICCWFLSLLTIASPLLSKYRQMLKQKHWMWNAGNWKLEIEGESGKLKLNSRKRRVECWTLNIEHWILNIDHLILNNEYWALSIEYWILKDETDVLKMKYKKWKLKVKLKLKWKLK
jgi:hypothetical protein